MFSPNLYKLDCEATSRCYTFLESPWTVFLLNYIWKLVSVRYCLLPMLYTALLSAIIFVQCCILPQSTFMAILFLIQYHLVPPSMIYRTSFCNHFYAAFTFMILMLQPYIKVGLYLKLAFKPIHFFSFFLVYILHVSYTHLDVYKRQPYNRIHILKTHASPL